LEKEVIGLSSALTFLFFCVIFFLVPFNSRLRKEEGKMKLIQPAIYKEGSENWIRLQDLLEMSKRDFGMEPSEVWSDLQEWQKPEGLLWTRGDGTINNALYQQPQNFEEIYIPEIVARHFYHQASLGVRNVVFDGKKGYRFRWK
jgi:hypothetical protein